MFTHLQWIHVECQPQAGTVLDSGGHSSGGKTENPVFLGFIPSRLTVSALPADTWMLNIAGV